MSMVYEKPRENKMPGKSIKKVGAGILLATGSVLALKFGGQAVSDVPEYMDAKAEYHSASIDRDAAKQDAMTASRQLEKEESSLTDVQWFDSAGDVLELLDEAIDANGQTIELLARGLTHPEGYMPIQEGYLPAWSSLAPEQPWVCRTVGRKGNKQHQRHSQLPKHPLHEISTSSSVK